jgi:ABC-type sugar transport system permease subunit
VLLYNTAFRSNRFGEAAAVGVLLLVLVLAFAIVYVKVARLDRMDTAR